MSYRTKIAVGGILSMGAMYVKILKNFFASVEVLNSYEIVPASRSSSAFHSSTSMLIQTSFVSLWWKMSIALAGV
jgi:hypothetical protein